MRFLRFAFALGLAFAASDAAVAQAPAAAPASAKSFVVYSSPLSRRLLAEDPVDLKARVNRWRDLLRERGANVTIVTYPAQLEQMPPGAALIVPSAVVLTDEERRVILKRIDAGDSLLATWMPGTLDLRAAAVPATFIEQAFGVPARPVAKDEKGFLITVGDTPLTHALPAGTRVWIGRDKRYPTPLLATTGAGYLADWSRAQGDTGLITYTTKNASRRVLLGWPESVWEGQPAEFRKLAELALDWIEGKPVAYERSWPWPYRGAVTIGVDALWRFENVSRLGQTMSSSGLRGSFHFLPADTKPNASLIRDLVREGHSIGGFGDVAEPFAGQPESEQRARLERMVQEFRSALGPDFKVTGFRAPQGATDAATEKAAASLDYVVDAGRIDSVTPVLGPDRKLVLLSASANFDTNSTADAIAQGLSGAMQRINGLGGYAFVGVDAAGFQRDSPLEAGIQRFIESARQRPRDLWVASAADVAAWWREHEQFNVAGNWDAASSTLALDIVVGVPMRFSAAVAIVPPPERRNVKVEQSVAGVQLQPDATGQPTLVVTGLPAGRHRVSLRFAP